MKILRSCKTEINEDIQHPSQSSVCMCTVEGHLSCIQFLSIMSKVAMNIVKQEAISYANAFKVITYFLFDEVQSIWSYV
ncbi:hypothetical protein STEG23_028403 [Scotinomys teguina]